MGSFVKLTKDDEGLQSLSVGGGRCQIRVSDGHEGPASSSCLPWVAFGAVLSVAALEEP